MSGHLDIETGQWIPHPQLAIWDLDPPRDATPLEPGGAVIVVRLSRDEVDSLPLAPTLTEAVHIVLGRERP